jgi:hypothetical protein
LRSEADDDVAALHAAEVALLAAAADGSEGEEGEEVEEEEGVGSPAQPCRSVRERAGLFEAPPLRRADREAAAAALAAPRSPVHAKRPMRPATRY